MSTPDDFEERLRKYEEEGVQLPEEEEEWYERMKAAAMAKGELNLKRELETYYSDYQKTRKNKLLRYTFVGIAASLVLGLFLFYNFQTNPATPIQLQQNEQPVFSDSASHDSTRLEQLKKNEKDSVDKQE